MVVDVVVVVDSKLEKKLEEVSRALATAEAELASLGAAASTAAAAERDSKQLRDDVTALREQIKVKQHPTISHFFIIHVPGFDASNRRSSVSRAS